MKRTIVIGLFMLLTISLTHVPVQAGTTTQYTTQYAPIPLDSTLFDLFVMRPMGIAACAVGIVTSVWAMPFALTSGAGNEVGEKLITEPIDWTFKRPIGYDY